MTLVTLYHCLLVGVFSLHVSASCYYPDGTYVPADRPCIGNGSQESFCCGLGFTCLSDKVCYTGNQSVLGYQTYLRGSCNDQSFRSSACPQFCLTSANKGGIMFQCGFQTDSYCCSPDDTPCSCETNNITLAASLSDVSSIAFIEEPAASTATSETQVVPFSDTSSIETFSARTTNFAELPAEKPSSSVPSVTVSSSATLILSNSMPPSEPIISANPPSSSHSNAKNEAAFGAPIAVLSVLVIVLVSALIRHKRRTRSTVANIFDHMLDSSSNTETLNISSSAKTYLELPAETPAVEMESRMESRMERPELAA